MSARGAAPRARYAVIMAGGVGTRFWPHSRRRRPKQFLALDGGRTLLQETAHRLRGVVPWSRIVVVAPRDLAALVRRQLPRLPRANLIIEPAARGTAACLALTAAWIARRAPDATMGVFPADHVIRNVAGFQRSVRRAFETAEQHDCLVTFGIRPLVPETGYGYVETGAVLRRGAPRVDWAARFVEKPDRATAQRFVESGRHWWNSGMFVWRVAVLRAAFERHAPELGRVMDRFSSARRGDVAAARRAFQRLPAVSIDVAVMERAKRVAVVVATFDWSDVGSWAAIPALWGIDANGNAARGPAVLVDCHDTLVNGTSRLVAVLGMRDVVVVDSPDAVLVCPRSRAQDVRQIVAALERGAYRRWR
jgi:mannose-1-phosphate guanylyltransferase